MWPAPTRSGHLEGSSIKKQHANALKLSKVRPFVLYSLRHTFLTRLGSQAATLGLWRGSQGTALSRCPRDTFIHPRMLFSPRLKGWVGTILGTVNKRLTTQETPNRLLPS